MIYLKHTTDPQVAYIPRDAEAAGPYRMTLRSTADLDTVVNAPVLDLSVFSRYYAISVKLPADCPSGEFEYTFLSGGLAVSSGVAVVLADASPVKQYDKPIEYEQYEK